MGDVDLHAELMYATAPTAVLIDGAHSAFRDTSAHSAKLWEAARVIAGQPNAFPNSLLLAFAGNASPGVTASAFESADRLTIADLHFRPSEAEELVQSLNREVNSTGSTTGVAITAEAGELAYRMSDGHCGLFRRLIEALRRDGQHSSRDQVRWLYSTPVLRAVETSRAGLAMEEETVLRTLLAHPLVGEDNALCFDTRAVDSG